MGGFSLPGRVFRSDRNSMETLASIRLDPDFAFKKAELAAGERQKEILGPLPFVGTRSFALRLTSSMESAVLTIALT